MNDSMKIEEEEEDDIELSSSLNVEVQEKIDVTGIIHWIRSNISNGLNHSRQNQFISQEFSGLKNQFDNIYDLLEKTVDGVEANSILLMGPKGSGKSLTLYKTLHKLEEKYGEHTFKKVCLNGLLHAEDEKICLQEIIRQLNPNFKSIETEENKKEGFAEKVKRLIETLKFSKHQKQSVIFVLEEFDLFCSAPKRQTILYTLLDCVHFESIKISLIGLTSRIDVLDLLEKRVKSRFSQKQINFFGIESVSELSSVLQTYLLLNISSWDASIQALFQEKKFIKLLEYNLTFVKDMRWYLKWLELALTRLNNSHPQLDIKDFNWANNSLHFDSKVELLKSLSVLELGLIVTMKRLQLQSVFQCNFEQIFHEYNEFSSKHLAELNVPRAVCLKAFERIIELELVKLVDTRGISTPKEFRMAKLMVFPQQITQVLNSYDECPAALQKWGTSYVE